MSPSSSEEQREWRVWFGVGSAVLVALVVASFVCLFNTASCCPVEADSREPDDSESINANIGTLHIRSEPTTGGDQDLVEAVNGLARAITPLKVELSVDGINVKPFLAISKAVASIAEGLKSPVDVRVSGLDGCASGDCQTSVFVAGDLNWPNEPTETQAEACQLAWVGRVCGFGVAEVDEHDADDLLESSFGSVKTRIKAWGDEGGLKWLALVGRADRMAFIDQGYGGNRGLAQARARWVHGELGKLEGAPVVADVLKARTLVISAGPLNVPCVADGANCDDTDVRLRDRSVDVYACVAAGVTKQSGTGDGAYDADGCGGPAGWSRGIESVSTVSANGPVESEP